MSFPRTNTPFSSWERSFNEGSPTLFQGLHVTHVLWLLVTLVSSACPLDTTLEGKFPLCEWSRAIISHAPKAFNPHTNLSLPWNFALRLSSLDSPLWPLAALQRDFLLSEPALRVRSFAKMACPLTKRCCTPLKPLYWGLPCAVFHDTSRTTSVRSF